MIFLTDAFDICSYCRRQLEAVNYLYQIVHITNKAMVDGMS